MGGGFLRLGDGRLVRCAQKGGPVYGSGLQLMQVDELTAETYLEHLVEEIGPHWRRGATGVHHLHQLDDVAVLDASIRRWRWRWPNLARPAAPAGVLPPKP